MGVDKATRRALDNATRHAIRSPQSQQHIFSSNESAFTDGVPLRHYRAGDPDLGSADTRPQGRRGFVKGMKRGLGVLTLTVLLLTPLSVSAQADMGAMFGAMNAPIVTGGMCATDAPMDLTEVDALLRRDSASGPLAYGGEEDVVGAAALAQTYPVSTAGEAKRIRIPVVFTIFYDSQFPVAAYEAWRETWPPEAREAYPNTTDSLLVTEESVLTAIEQLNWFYRESQIEFVLYDGVEDPIRWVDEPFMFFDWYGVWGANGGLEYLRPVEMAYFGVDYPNVLNIFLHMQDELGVTGQGAFPSDILNPDLPWAIDMDFRRMPGVTASVRPDLDPGPRAHDFRDLDVNIWEIASAENNGVLIHEVGHCLGLFHTFTYSTPFGAGDYADDTPYEAEPFAGDGIQRNATYAAYPIDRNTEDDSWYWRGGQDPPDPVRNIMDYGAFHYREHEITRGQQANIARQIARFLPQFIVQSKPLKTAKDRLLVWADFDDEDLSDGTIFNGARWGQKIAVFLRKALDTSGATLIPYGIGALLGLWDGAHLFVQEDDLAVADADQARFSHTIALWFQLFDPAAADTRRDGLPLAPGLTVGAPDFVAAALGFTLVPYLPWDPDVAVLAYYVRDETGALHEELVMLPAAMLDGYWNHMAIVYEADAGVTYYINGYALGPLQPYGPTELWGFLKFGQTQIWYADGTSDQAGFDGVIDDFAIYNVALSAEEIASLMTSGPDAAWLREEEPLDD